MNTKWNRQYEQTHQRIVDAVIAALQRDPIRKVTVTRICKELAINRSTFYEHFADVYDVLEKTERSLGDELTRRMLDPGESRSTYDDVFGTMFEFVREHQRFYRLYLSQGGTIQLSEHVVGDTTAYLQRLHRIDPLEMEYRLVFFTRGMNAMIAHWLERDCADPIDALLTYIAHQFAPDLATLFDE